MNITKNEQYKLNQLKRIFTIDISRDNDIYEVLLSKCWKFLGFSLEEALDKCFLDIKETKARSDNDVYKAYLENRK